MKLWIDDLRPAPEGYHWIKTTNAALLYLTHCSDKVELIDLDHDAGDFVAEGGDYINILNKMEEFKYAFDADFSHINFRLHSANPVGVANMRAIIERNGWKEIK